MLLVWGKDHENRIKVLAFVLLVFIGISILFITEAKRVKAQNWAALPPYNTLWPLWSSVLSPANSYAGLSTHVVTSLTPKIFLPYSPA